ncbi:MAG: DUF1667 domain-containing protein [Ruminococcaceae bacterium]|nr:DUF1667 domain-containing protein [Oscillospiraceae bacterium]MBO4972922.1 DUF1667 domain-containing protein [Clostridia bacterium]MBQ1258883.1 DUF1667 domain-containing protein [Clostridia bacterium]
MINLVCIICPRGCRLTVDEKHGNAVSGNLCPRGAAYALSEVTDSRRTITSTIKIEGSYCQRCPVKSERPIPKGLMFEAMKELNAASIKAPVKVGDVVLENVCGTGINFISTKTM